MFEQAKRRASAKVNFRQRQRAKYNGLETTGETEIQSATELVADLWRALTYTETQTWGKILCSVTMIYKSF